MNANQNHNLTAEEQEQVRLSLLRYGLGGFTLGMAWRNLVDEGWRFMTMDHVEHQVKYLADPAKGLLREDRKLVSPEVKRWTTTADGQDYLASLPRNAK